MKNASKIILTASVMTAIMAFYACQSNEETPPPPVPSVKWAWVTGSQTVNQTGTYGTKGVAAATNVPGAREDAEGWVDTADKLWLFGGFGYDSTGYPGRMNDLWMFDPAARAWTWIAGSDVRDPDGVYGTLGLADPVSAPGGRNGAASWTDASGRLWLFGGLGFDGAGEIGQTNDLWRFDPATTQWTWLDGSSLRNRPGVYGTKGVPSSSNIPGARVGAASAVDPDGAFWLYGGFGYDAAGAKGRLNDLWKLDPATLEWTWISGSDTLNQLGVYGDLNEPAPENVPGSRYDTCFWIDASGVIWVCGGDGVDSLGQIFKLNDVWKLDPATLEWTWVDGSKIVGVTGVYGELNIPDQANYPGSRSGAVTWVQADGAVFLFGGWGIDASSGEGWLDDVWKFDQTLTTWAWVSGPGVHGYSGKYGTQGTASTSNIPGGRHYPVSWITSLGVRWLFGGYGLDSAGAGGHLNDLWRQE